LWQAGAHRGRISAPVLNDVATELKVIQYVGKVNIGTIPVTCPEVPGQN